MPIEKMKKGNAEFINIFEVNKKLYSNLVNNGQHPKVLWVGCSDSRVVPEFTVNANTGDLFVTRNIANIIPPAESGDSCTSSILEYAVLHLHVEHIIICGHTECGGINEVISGPPENTRIEKWLQHAYAAKESAKKCCKEALVLNTTKENILLQAKNLRTFDYIEKRVVDGKLTIHEWLYDMSSGLISFFEEKNGKWISLI